MLSCLFITSSLNKNKLCYQWCRFLLSIGGNKLQFCPKFARFSTLGEMNLNHDLFQVSKLSKNQKKALHQKLKSFFPRNYVKTEKQVQTSSSAQMQTTVKLLGGCRCRPQSNYWGMQSNYWGRYIPPFLPGFVTPVRNYL